MTRLLLCAFVLGCSSGGATYQKGAYRPAPAYTPAGIGAPDPGQPRAPSEYPRSPPGRVLPETPETRREPGIWAASPTDPLLDVDPGELWVSPVPYPPNPTPYEKGWSNLCALSGGRFTVFAMNVSYEEAKARIARWDPKDASCVAARLFYACAILAYSDIERLRKEAAIDGRPQLPSLKRTKEAASTFVDNNCTGVFLQGDPETVRSRATILMGNWFRQISKRDAR